MPCGKARGAGSRVATAAVTTVPATTAPTIVQNHQRVNTLFDLESVGPPGSGVRGCVAAVEAGVAAIGGWIGAALAIGAAGCG